MSVQSIAVAKKKRTTKRSTKAGKRRPSTKRKPKTKAKRERIVSAGTSRAGGVGAAIAAATGSAAGTSTATGVGAFQRTGLSAAVESTLGEVKPPAAVEPPPTDLSISTTPPEVRIQGDSSWRADATIIPAPVTITPTVYPDSPQGTVVVQNHVTINIQSVEFIRFDKNLEALIGELHRSNEISGEIRDQLVSELWAGREIVGAPKPQRDLIELLLVRPLKWLTEKSGSAMVSKLATDALNWLLKMIL